MVEKAIHCRNYIPNVFQSLHKHLRQDIIVNGVRQFQWQLYNEFMIIIVRFCVPTGYQLQQIISHITHSTCDVYFHWTDFQYPKHTNGSCIFSEHTTVFNNSISNYSKFQIIWLLHASGAQVTTGNMKLFLIYSFPYISFNETDDNVFVDLRRFVCFCPLRKYTKNEFTCHQVRTFENILR